MTKTLMTPEVVDIKADHLITKEKAFRKELCVDNCIYTSHTNINIEGSPNLNHWCQVNVSNLSTTKITNSFHPQLSRQKNISFVPVGASVIAQSCILMTFLALFSTFWLCNAHLNYREALKKSIIFLEAQRSGKLPPNHRPPWRGDSALEDGKEAGVDLVGGYYDAGDNVKYQFPMAFTVTTMAWAAYFYEPEIKDAGEMNNLLDGIRWGTDYFLKASEQENQLFVQVGDPKQDHQCWMRPENMRTPRTVLEINQNLPGTEIAAETAAALAASAIVFRKVDLDYAESILDRSKQLFQFAEEYKGTFDGACPFYCSYSGYNDELLWGAAWLYIATRDPQYLQYLQEETTSAVVYEFSWDLKYAGVQVLLSQLYWEGQKEFKTFQRQADEYICSVLPDSPYRQPFMTPGGLINFRDGANSQFVTSTTFLFSVYSDLLARNNMQVTCGDRTFTHVDLMSFTKQEMDYLLGNNPVKRSIMVGFGHNPPVQAHHRGASVPVLTPTEDVNCGMSFVYWYNTDEPNPSELTGAILGGPDRADNFIDKRVNSSNTEPCTYINSCAIGVLAKLAIHHASA